MYKYKFSREHKVKYFKYFILLFIYLFFGCETNLLLISTVGGAGRFGASAGQERCSQQMWAMSGEGCLHAASAELVHPEQRLLLQGCLAQGGK